MNEELMKKDEDSITEVLDINAEEVLNSVKLSDKEPVKEPVKETIQKTQSKDEKIKDETKALYDEFSDFLEIKADMTLDAGVKLVVPTGIDLLDAILGGGFAVGALNIIVGTPGSGKCLCYDEEIEVYVEK
jgi:replicative DNA helicase